MMLWNNIRVATRTWRRAPALAAVIVLTLALGVGGTTTGFTLAYSVLVRPLPFPEAGELFRITTYNTRETGDGTEVLNTNRLPQPSSSAPRSSRPTCRRAARRASIRSRRSARSR